MEEVVEFLSILNLENHVWYTVRVELEKTCQPQQESSFPAIIDVTDGKRFGYPAVSFSTALYWP